MILYVTSFKMMIKRNNYCTYYVCRIVAVIEQIVNS